MKRSAVAALAALTWLTACGSANPLNWFGGSEPPDTITIPVEADPRPLVPQITEMEVSPVVGGAMVRATGLMPNQGWWDAELVPENFFEPVDGALSFRFVAARPFQPTRAGPPQSRELSAAIFVPTPTLNRTRLITVTAAENFRTVRR